jgi:hypothetical protein
MSQIQEFDSGKRSHSYDALVGYLVKYFVCFGALIK